MERADKWKNIWVIKQRDRNYENQKEILEVKNTVKEMKNVFNGLISRLDTPEERIHEL